MPKCSNCGQTTERTEDWACQWCGHPLTSKSFKKIPKTYKQLKEEFTSVKEAEFTEEDDVQQSADADTTLSYTQSQEPDIVPETIQEPELGQEPQPVSKSESEPEQKQELIPEPEPVSEPVQAPNPKTELKQEPQPVPEPVTESEPFINSSPDTVSEDEPESEVIHLPASMSGEAPGIEPVSESENEVIPLPVANPVNVPEPESDSEDTLPEQSINNNSPPIAPESDISVEQLLAAYAEDDAAANARFVAKHIRITGIVDKIEIKDYLDIYYISLNNAERSSLQTVRCIFDKKDMDKLKNLVPGQKVTVSGRFDGSIIDFRMNNCELVN